MGLKNNIVFAVFEQPKRKPYPMLRELFAYEDEAREHVRYLKMHKREKNDLFVSPVPINYGQVL